MEDPINSNTAGTDSVNYIVYVLADMDEMALLNPADLSYDGKRERKYQNFCRICDLVNEKSL